MYQGFLVRCSWIKRVKKRRFVKRVGKFGGRPPRHYVFLYTKQRIDVCARLRLIAARVWRPWFSIPSHNSIVNRSTLLPSLPSPLPGWMEGFPIRHHDLHDERKSLSLSLSSKLLSTLQNSTLQFYESNRRVFSFPFSAIDTRETRRWHCFRENHPICRHGSMTFIISRSDILRDK